MEGSGSTFLWGPGPLAQVLADQLESHGLSPEDGASCARELQAAIGPAARASLFVDLGACAFLQGDLAGALGAWQQAIVSGQQAPAGRALYNLGLLHEQLGLYGQALGRLEEAESYGIEPYCTQATLARARTHLAKGDTALSLRTLERLAAALVERVGQSPLVGDVKLGIGRVAQSQGDVARSERAYRDAIDHGNEETRASATLALVSLLRSLGHDDEAQQVVDDAGLESTDPETQLDRAELLIRLGRLEDAAEMVARVDPSGLTSASRFRFATAQIDLGLVNESIDVLEELATEGSPESRARAAYQLGELYLVHEMIEPAITMFQVIRPLQGGYWADKASLVLGDLAMDRGEYRDAASHWSDAAASPLDSISGAARSRLADAVERVPVSEQAEPGSSDEGSSDSDSSDSADVDSVDGDSTESDADQIIELTDSASPVRAHGDDLDPPAGDEEVIEDDIIIDLSTSESEATVIKLAPDSSDGLEPLDLAEPSRAKESFDPVALSDEAKPSGGVELPDLLEPSGSAESLGVAEHAGRAESLDVAETPTGAESTAVDEPSDVVETEDVVEPSGSAESLGIVEPAEPAAVAEPANRSELEGHPDDEQAEHGPVDEPDSVDTEEVAEPQIISLSRRGHRSGPQVRPPEPESQQHAEVAAGSTSSDAEPAIVALHPRASLDPNSSTPPFRTVSSSNPYQSLAPAPVPSDVAPSSDPYAELAPEFPVSPDDPIDKGLADFIARVNEERPATSAFSRFTSN